MHENAQVCYRSQWTIPMNNELSGKFKKELYQYTCISASQNAYISPLVKEMKNCFWITLRAKRRKKKKKEREFWQFLSPPRCSWSSPNESSHHCFTNTQEPSAGFLSMGNSHGNKQPSGPNQTMGPMPSYSLYRCKKSFYYWKITLLGRFYVIREYSAASVAGGQARVYSAQNEGHENPFNKGPGPTSKHWKKASP